VYAQGGCITRIATAGAAITSRESPTQPQILVVHATSPPRSFVSSLGAVSASNTLNSVARPGDYDIITFSGFGSGHRMRPMPCHASGVSMFHSQRAHPMSGFWSIRTPDALSNVVLSGGNNKTRRRYPAVIRDEGSTDPPCTPPDVGSSDKASRRWRLEVSRARLTQPLREAPPTAEPQRYRPLPALPAH
jgi:hypothetical protein